MSDPMGNRGSGMIWRLKVKRGWNQACEKAEIALGAFGSLGGMPVGLVSIEMSMSHMLTLEFAPCQPTQTETLKPIKYWLRAMARSHR